MKKTDTAIILAGGKSSRMGFDKQQMRFKGDLAAVNIAKRLSGDFRDIIIVSNKPQLYEGLPYTILKDVIHDFGPLGGLYTGLLQSKSQFAYLIACDMPSINLNYIRYMKTLIQKDSSMDALVTHFENEMAEPFNAFYSKNIICEIEKMALENRPQIHGFLKTISTQYVPHSVASKFSPNWEMFRNLNTRRDLPAFEKSSG